MLSAGSAPPRSGIDRVGPGVSLERIQDVCSILPTEAHSVEPGSRGDGDEGRVCRLGHGSSIRSIAALGSSLARSEAADLFPRARM